MAKLAIKKASTDVTVYLFIQDSSKTTGEGLTGLAYNTASLVASYVRPAAARAALSLATQTVTGGHSDGGFVEVDATNMPGVYRLDLPDAVCATGVPSVVVMLKGATNMSPVVLEIQLTDFDLNSTSNAVGAAASVTAGVTLADDAITASKFDESTAYPLKSADTGSTQVARVGADSDTLETLSNQLDAVQAKTDLLDVSSVIVSSAISGTAITILRGDTFECSISDLGSLADYVSLDFTVKSDKSDADTAALIRIRLNATGLTDGLLTLNGATPSNADDGSIAITDAAAGDITITLAASCTDDLATGTYVYDVQLIEASEVSTLTSGKATVTADVTRAVA